MQKYSRKPKPTRLSFAKAAKAAAISIDLRILILRRQRVILDTALAELYDVPVKRLHEQAKRNRKTPPKQNWIQTSSRADGVIVSGLR